MPLMNRFARLFTADLHAVLDRLEEPDLLLKQAVREMAEELAAMQTRASTLRRELEHLQAEDRAMQTQIARFDEELDLCFAAGEDELARGLVRRKLEAEQRQRTLGARREALAECERNLAAAIAEGTGRLDDMRQQLALLVEAPGDPLAVGATTVNPPAIGDHEVEVAWLRERQRRTPA